VVYSGKEVTPQAGAAYVFYRRSPEIDLPCSTDRELCTWTQQVRCFLSFAFCMLMHAAWSLLLRDRGGVN
jgi:hypothetical protein